MMKGHYRKQSQFELFPGRSKDHESKEKFRGFSSSLVFSFENLVVLCVIITMSMVVSFSLGVEKGKKERVRKKIKQEEKKTKTVKKQTPEIEAIVMTGNLSSIKESLFEPQGSLNNTSAVGSNGESSQRKAAQKKTVDKMYTVQVASFRTEKYAEQEAKSLKDKGHEIFIIPKGKYSIVCIGKFSKKDDAQRLSSQLKGRYRDCLIRSL